jgi:CubicO group peptidase (beta-lactamase class C family)
MLLMAAFLIFSCSDKDKKVTAEVQKSTDTMVRLQPYKIKSQKLNPQYVANKKAAIDRFVNKTWRADRDNVSLLVSQNGQIIYEKYQGYADRNEDTDITASTPLHIASVTKVLTATAILQLIDAGKIELDQKVNTILKTFPYSDITIKTLLNHRSGLRNYAYYADQKEIWDKKNILRNQDILDLFVKNNTPLDFVTDKKFAYCNTNYAMLALIIEKITGLKYPQAMKEMIFKPLGMNDSYVFEYDVHRKSAIPSYKGNNVEIGLDFLDAVYGDKNVYSTPRDLLKFDLARYSPEFLNQDLIKKAYVGYSYEHKGEKNYGLGIRMIEWVTGQHFYFHNGWWHGNTSSYVNLRKEKVMIIALSNKYSQKTYKVRFLATLFGDYPFKMEKEDVLE